jgi:hypothetical protein
VEDTINRTDGFLTVYVDSPGVPAVVPATATTDCLGRVQFECFPPARVSGAAIIEIADGGYLLNPYRFVSCTVQGAPSAQPSVRLTGDGTICIFIEGSALHLLAGAAAPLLRMEGNDQEVVFILGSGIQNDAASGLSVVDCPTEDNQYIAVFVTEIGNSGPPQTVTNAFQGVPLARLVWVHDASVAPVTQPNFAGDLIPLPMDWAKGVAYNDTLVSPLLGANDVQDAIDRLKQRPLLSIVWRPGGVDAPGIYSTWAGVCGAIDQMQGSVQVLVDTSLGAAVADTLQNCYGRTWFCSYTPQSLGAVPTMSIEDPGTLLNVAGFDNLHVVATPTAAPPYVPIQQGLDDGSLIFTNYAILERQPEGDAPVITVTGSGNPQVSFLQGAYPQDDGEAPTRGMLQIGTHPGAMRLVLQNQLSGAGIPPTLVEGIVSDTLNVHYDLSVDFPAQSFFAGTLNLLPEDQYLPAANVPVVENYCYVSPGGNDGTGTGSISHPFATVEAAMASITTASPTSRWAIVVAGRVNDTNPIALLADVFIVGYSPQQSRVTSPAWSLDAASWATAGDHRGGFINVTVAGSGLPVDFDAISSNEGKFYLTGAWVNIASTFTRFSSINQFLLEGCRFFGTADFNGGQCILRNNVFASDVSVSEGPSSGAYQVESQGNAYRGTLTINYTSAGGCAVSLSDDVNALEVNGPLAVSATVNAVTATPVLTGGASLVLKSAARGIDFTPPGGLSPVVATNIQDAATEICGYLGFLGAGVTGSRPLPASVPAGWFYFDTTLGKPVWNTGAGYVDATGAPA